jgi:two-component system sensor histidine kinase/response regulator
MIIAEEVIPLPTPFTGDKQLRFPQVVLWHLTLVARGALAQIDAPSKLWAGGQDDILLNFLLPLLGAALLWALVAWVRKPAGGFSLGGFLAYGLQPLLISGLVLLLGLGVVAYQVKTTRDEVFSGAWLRFQLQVDRLEGEIQDKFEKMLPTLRGARGLLTSSGRVTRPEFRNFADSQAVDAELPGVRGVGVIERVARGALPAFVAAQRREGAEDFAVRTLGTAPDLFVIKFIEPLDRNRAALGFDVGSEDVGRAAAERAMREGKPVLTGRVAFLQDGVQQPGFLYMLPVYASVRVPETEPERLRLFKGLTYSPVVLAELMSSVVADAQGLSNFQLFGGTEIDAPSLMYDSSLPLGLTEGPDGFDHAKVHMFNVTRPFFVGGQIMQLRASTTADFERGLDLQSPQRMAFYGSALAVLASLVVWLLLVTRQRALVMAQSMAVELNKTEAALQHERARADAILAGTNVGTWQSNLQTGESTVSERWAGMLGYSVEEMRADTAAFWAAHVHPEDAVRVANAQDSCRRQGSDHYSVEIRVRHKNGNWMWILSRARVMTRTPDGDVEWLGGIHTDITDSKQLEIRLRDMESFLHRAGRLAGVGAWELDIKTQKIVWSSQTCEIHGEEPGFSPDTAQALRYFDADAQARLRGHLLRATEQGLGWDVTERLTDARDSVKWVRMVGDPEFDDSGPVRVVGSYQDVTREKEIQLGIERSEAILRGSIDAVNEAYVLYDPQDRLVFCNDKYRELYAISADLLAPGATFESIIRGGAERGQYQTAIEDVDAWVAERLATHTAGNTDLEERLDDGRWLRVVERTMADGHHVGFRVDITELKEASERAEAANRQLLETSSTLQAVLDSAVEVGVMATDLARKITVFNKGAENLLGYTAAELIGKHTSSLFFDLDQITVLKESLGLVLGREATASDIFYEVASGKSGSEWVLVRKDGSTFTASMKISPLVDGWGVVTGFLGIVYDISRQKEYESSLRAAMMRAEESSTAKSQFLANMSHEIRTPMNAILGMLRLLKSTPLAPRQLDYTNKTDAAARSLLGLLNDVLDFSKVEAGKMQLDPEPFELNALMGDLSVILSSNLGGKNVDLLFEVDPAIPRTLVGDALRIKQILINLGGNAVKFTQQGQVVVGWRMLAKHLDRVRLEVSVRDSGIGIAPENQARIFEAFTQAESSTTRRFGGTGLGLVISTRLIRLMGGELELSSALGEGSTFTFALELPVVHDAPAMADATVARGGPTHVLLVDDNPVALSSSASMMRSLGWVVTEAASGELALQAVGAAIDKQPFDALFIDWQMPGMDGWDTLRAVRRLYGARALPAMVLISGQNRDALDSRTGREQELLDGFMVKPLTVTMFEQALAQALETPGLTPSATDPAQSLLPLRGMRILVVEDNMINQQVAQELLVAQGAEVTLADDGQQGVMAVNAAQPPFDAVLMDMQMPVMDGLMATRALRQNPALRSLPIIAMTANAMASDREACLKAGMNDHVGKPFDLDDLVQTLVRHTRWAPAVDHAATAVDAQRVPAAVQVDWPPGVDVKGALARLGGNTGLLHRSMSTFIADAPHLAQRIPPLMDQGGLQQAQRELHAFKGLAATMGVAALSTLAANAEKLCVQVQHRAEFDAVFSQLCADTQAVLPVLRDVAQRLAAQSGAKRAAAPVQPERQSKALQSLRALLVALQAADMGAMEMHAALRLDVGDSLGSALEPLDAAMAELEFEVAALECNKLVELLDRSSNH